MRLAETEYRVMHLIWANEGITAKDLAEALRQQVNWSKTTTYTVISRCIQKGYIRREDPRFHCYSKIPMAQVAEAELNALIGHYYDGSPETLLRSMLESGLLTADRTAALAAET